MRRIAIALFLAFASVTLPTGCQLGPWGGPAYDVDYGKIGTGEQAITPRNDAFYMNGEPQDYRSNR